MPGERTSLPAEACWGEKYEGVVAGVADAEVVGVRAAAGLDTRRERIEVATELAEEGRRSSDGRSGVDSGCECLGVGMFVVVVGVVCASAAGRVSCREAGKPVCIAPVELRWRVYMDCFRPGFSARLRHAQ